MAQLKTGTTIGGNTAYHQGNLDLASLKGMSENEKVNQNTLIQNVARLNFQDSLEAIAYKGGTFDIFTDETKIASKTQVAVSTLAVGADNGSVVLGFETQDELDNSFTNNATDTIYVVEKTSDGKVYVGGNFGSIGGHSSDGLARLNSDYSIDTSFTMTTNGNVRAICQTSDGKIYIGGQIFTSIGGYSKTRLARLNSDGSLDISYSMDANADVYDICEAIDGKVYIVGNFSSIGGVSKGRLARLNSDGTLDSAYSMDINADTFEIEQASNGKIYVGGNFGNIGGNSRSCIARLNSDGTFDSSYNQPVGVRMTATGVNMIKELSDGYVYLGCGLSSFGSSANASLVRISQDGVLDENFDIITTSLIAVNDITRDSNGNYFIGGNFTSIFGVSFSRLAKLNSDLSPDTSFSIGSTNNAVENIINDNGNLFVFGSFTNFGGQDKIRIAKVSLSQFYLSGSFETTTIDLTGDLATNPTKVVVSSTFATPTDTTLSLKISDGTPANDVTITSANFDTEVDCSSLTTRTLTLQWLFTTSDTAVTPTLNNYGVYFT